MRQTNTVKNNRIKRCSSLRGLRRLISVIMLMSLLLTGCKSILVSGDLSFQANEPVSPMGAAEGIHEVLLETVDFAKYDIDGESAFWMLPGHLNPVYLGFDMEKETDDIMLADFKAIGYSEIKNRFVYAYLTPIFSSKEYPIRDLTGLTVPKTGNADKYTIPDPPANLSAKSPYVMVLMSYEPATKNYNVFFCKYISYAYYSEKQPVLMAGKVAGSDLYYIYDPTTMTVEIYDIDGNMRSGRSYMYEIMAAVKEVLGIPKRWAIWHHWLYKWYHWRYSITDVQVDDEMSVYLNVQVEVSEKPFDDESMKHLLDENDDNYDDDQSTEDYDQSNKVVYYNAAIATYSLNLGGENPTIKFTSNIKDDVKTFCEESTKLAPVYIDLTEDVIAEAKKKYIESLGEGADENTKVPDNIILEYAKSASGYNSLISSGVNKNESSLYDEYYKKVKDALNKGYHEFDTSDMVDQGINLYYALAGIPDLKNMKIKTPDCKEDEWIDVKDPRSNSEFIYDSLDETYESGGYMKNSQLSYENILLASFLASRTYGPKKGKNIPDWMLEYYTPEYLKSDPESAKAINDLIERQVLAAYFIEYDGEVMYPFLTPGDFVQDNNDANHPAMKRVSRSPYAAEEKYTNKSTGFVEYQDYYRSDLWKIMGTYTDLVDRLPIVMLYGAQLYNDGNRTIGYQTITNNPSVGASKGKYVYCLPKMVVDETMTLEIRQPVYIRSHDQYSYHSELTATVEIPTKYRMVFPESTEIRAKGNVWVGEGLKALKGLGCVTYKTSGSSYRANNEPGWPQDDLTGGDLKIQIGQKYTWLQQTHLGENGAIFDEGIKGQARDVGIYKTADGVDEVIMLTDESLRFYKKENGEYNAYDEVMMDTLKRVSGYGLKVEGDVKETHVSENAAEKTNTDTMVERVTEKAMDEEEQEYNILADNLMPYTTNRLMICHEGDGVSVFDLKGESLMKVLGGHYYRIYPMKKSGTYVLLGFQTEEYDYTQADISMSKFYTIDLGELVDSESNNNISSYIDELKDIYQSKTHTIRYVGKEGDRKIYEIVDPEETEDKEYERAVRLFTDSDTKTIEELEAICKDYDVEVTDKMKEYALDIAGKIRNQRKALIAYYELIGIQMKGERGLPDTWQYLINESEVFTASYEGMLEIMLVEMVLSDDYTDFTVTHPIDSDNLDCLIGVESSGALKKTYERYKDDYRDWQTTRKNSDALIKVSGNEAGVDITGMDTEELTDTIVDLYSKRTEADDAGDITQMEFYQAVLSDIKMKYLRLNNPEGTADILSFDEYMVQLFNDISPDYGHDVFDSMLESGYGQFHALTGVPMVTEENQALYDWKEQDVMDDLSICRYEWQIEEVMVKYCLKLTEYKDTPAYHKAWDEYCKTNYITLEDQKKAFQSAEFYNIIKDKQNAALSLGTGKTWSESVGDILRKVGNSPIVK